MANWHLCGPEPGIFIYACFCNQNKWVHREQNMMELHSDVITVILPILFLLFAWFFHSPQWNITSGVFSTRLASPGWDAEGRILASSAKAGQGSKGEDQSWADDGLWLWTLCKQSRLLVWTPLHVSETLSGERTQTQTKKILSIARKSYCQIWWYSMKGSEKTV